MGDLVVQGMQRLHSCRDREGKQNRDETMLEGADTILQFEMSYGAHPSFEKCSWKLVPITSLGLLAQRTRKDTI